MAIQLGLVAVSAATDGSRAAGQNAELLAQVALELPNSRVAEREADTLGMRLATLAGYDPEAAVTLWQKMSGLGNDRPTEFLSTHPAPNDRLKSDGQETTRHGHNYFLLGPTMLLELSKDISDDLGLSQTPQAVPC